MRDHRPLQDIAAEATEGTGQALPHGGAIQRAFGRHAIDHIQAYIGGAAAEGSQAIGAEAFAFGDRVAFGEAPDLHTAAHEAAHVVQQRAGVQLLGGVGEAGDRYEAHADAVADRVVRGQSAEDLLDELAPASGGSPQRAIQRKGIRNATKPSVANTNTELVGGRATDQEKANTDTDRTDYAVSSTKVFATPEHDQSGWGFLVREAEADALRVELENRNYPGITWEVRRTAPKISHDPTKYVLIRPIAKDTPGLAMSPGDCYQKCLHTMNVVTAEAFFNDSNGAPVACDVFAARMTLMEEAFGGELSAEYWEHKARYLEATARGESYADLAGLDREMLAPYARLSPHDKSEFDRVHGINRYAHAGEQQGFITMADNSTKTKNFAFHAGGVLTQEQGGNDVVTWENFANWAADYGGDETEKQAAQTDYAVFKMYSNDATSGQTFHDQIALGGNTVTGLAAAHEEYGSTPITFPIRAKPPQPQVPMPVVLPEDALPALTDEEMRALIDSLLGPASPTGGNPDATGVDLNSFLGVGAPLPGENLDATGFDLDSSIDWGALLTVGNPSETGVDPDSLLGVDAPLFGENTGETGFDPNMFFDFGALPTESAFDERTPVVEENPISDGPARTPPWSIFDSLASSPSHASFDELEPERRAKRERSPERGEATHKKTKETRTLSYDEFQAEAGAQPNFGYTYIHDGKTWVVTTISTAGVIVERSS